MDGKSQGHRAIDCLIGSAVPPALEGITLDIPGAINFDEMKVETSGYTLFLSRSKNG